MRALLRFAPQSTHSSARLAQLAATLLASLAQNHPCRQARSFSALGMHCSLCSRRITDAERRYLPIAHFARSFSALGMHSSLCSRRITDADRYHLPIAHVVRTFSAFGRLCSLRSCRISALETALFALQERHLVGDQGATWWHGSHNLTDHPPKYQPNRTTNS